MDEGKLHEEIARDVGTGGDVHRLPRSLRPKDLWYWPPLYRG